VAGGLFGGAIWVAYDAVLMALAGNSDASPLGLAAAAAVASLNLLVNFVAWDSVRRVTLGTPSAIMRAQLHARVTKLVASLLVQVTMTIAAAAKDPVVVALADGLGAAIVSVIMVKAGIDLLAESVPDLLDRSAAHVAGPALAEAAAALPPAFALEVAVTCPEGAGVRAIEEVERQLAVQLASALPGVELAVSIRARLA
jgi:hypothetical protein